MKGISGIDFLDVEPQKIKDEIFTTVEGEIGETLYYGDERYAYTMAIVAVLTAFSQKTNDKIRQSLLRYARGEVLDAIGQRVGCKRLPAVSASTIMRFTTVSPGPERNIIIPAGTRVTADSVVYFATTSTVVIQAGNTGVDVSAECLTGGVVGNGYAVDTVTTLVDLIPYVSAVTNLNTSSGGDDGEPYDDDGDDHYRDRIRLAPVAFSTAGPKGAYEYYAKSADPHIGDVKVVSDEPGKVTIRSLMDDGSVPTEDVLRKIVSTLDDGTVRPMTDYVSAEVPEEITYDVDIKYYVKAEDETAVIKTIEGVGGSVERYIAWQSNVLGRDINPDKLRVFLLAPDWEDNLTGALRADITSPDFTVLGKNQIARHSGVVRVTHEVVEE